MKQIEYTEKQKIVLEVLKKFEDLFYEDYKNYSWQLSKWFKNIEEIKNKYGIVDKYLTLREHINKHSCGAYHRFYFKIDDVQFSNISSVADFERYYNSSLLDQYFVINDEYESNNGDCCSYQATHTLTIVRIDK